LTEGAAERLKGILKSGEEGAVKNKSEKYAQS
jgi:hypothetical protein